MSLGADGGPERVRLDTNLSGDLHPAGLGERDGRQPRDYRHKHVGSVASLGLHNGVAEIYGIKLKGFPAWLMHRTYHMSRMPTLNNKVRVIMGWTLALFFRREVVSLGELHSPRQEFERANRRLVDADDGSGHERADDQVPSPDRTRTEVLA